MELAGCDGLRDATRGCRLVLLTATDAEAEPLVRALREPENHSLATKRIVVGIVGTPRRGPAGVGRDPVIPGKAESVIRAVLAVGGCDKANAAHILSCLMLAMDPRPSLVLQVGVAGAFPRPSERTGGQPLTRLAPRSESAPGSESALQFESAPWSESAPEVGDLVLATEEIYADTGSTSPTGWLAAAELGLPIAVVGGSESGGRFRLDAALVRAAADVVRAGTESDRPEIRPAVLVGPCVTSSRVTGIRTEGESVARRWGALAESMEGAAAAHICALHGVPLLEVRGISNLVVDRDRSSWEMERAIEVAGRAGLALAAALDRLPLPGA